MRLTEQQHLSANERSEGEGKGKGGEGKEKGKEKGKGKLEVKLWQKRIKSHTPRESNP